MLTKGKVMLIVNPISGTIGKQQIAQTASQLLCDAGFMVDLRYTNAPRHAVELSAEAVERKYSAVIAVGGDGTVNETARSLCQTDVPLGIIPTGSGNGLARHLGIPIDVEEALKIIIEGNIIDSDYGTVNGHPFFCTFGVGFDAAVSHNFANQQRRGLMTYLKSGFEELLHYDAETYTISANGNLLTEKAFAITCCNASQYGNNAYIAPEASLVDGLLDIIIIHQGNPINTALVGVDLLTGYINKNTLIHALKAPSAVIYRKSEGLAHIDGEPTILDDIIEVKCHSKGLKIFAPTDVKPFRPIVTPMNSFWQEVWLKMRRTLNLPRMLMLCIASILSLTAFAADEQWVSCGMCSYTDDFINAMFINAGCQTYEVEVQESASTRHLYRLINPYGAAYPLNSPGDYDADNHYMIIHAEDPSKVYIEEFASGMNWMNYGEIYLNSEAWMQMQTADISEIDSAIFGTLKDDTITFPTGALCIAVKRNGPLEYESANLNGRFSLRIPGAGVENVASDDAPAEYYNLFGHPVENPSQGIFIRRQNGTSTLIAL